jgi:hypothetical protein
MAVEQAERTKSRRADKNLKVLVGPFSPPKQRPQEVKNPEDQTPFQILRDLYENYSNDIPPYMVHSSDPSPNYKIRNGWFSLVVGNLYDIDIEPMIATIPNLQQEIDDLTLYCQKIAFRRPNTKAAVDWADSIVLKVLALERPILSVEELMEKPPVAIPRRKRALALAQ